MNWYCPDCKIAIPDKKKCCSRCGLPGMPEDEYLTYVKSEEEHDGNPLETAFAGIATPEVLVGEASEVPVTKEAVSEEPKISLQTTAENDDRYYTEEDDYEDNEADVDSVKTAIKNIAVIAGIIGLAMVIVRVIVKKK